MHRQTVSLGLPLLLQSLMNLSLAIVEMKCLLRELYSRYKTRIAPEMQASMELYDQAISTRPIDQTCLLNLEPIQGLETEGV